MIKTKQYGLIVEENKNFVGFLDYGMRPDRRLFGYEFADTGDRLEIVYSYFRDGSTVEFFRNIILCSYYHSLVVVVL